ncbi:unnamed protein product, partial [Allacma fusca]
IMQLFAVKVQKIDVIYFLRTTTTRQDLLSPLLPKSHSQQNPIFCTNSWIYLVNSKYSTRKICANTETVKTGKLL